MSDYGLPSVAYHEAGHCVMHIRTGGQVDWVTITRKGDADGGVSANGLWTNIATVAGHFAELRWAYTTLECRSVGYGIPVAECWTVHRVISSPLFVTREIIGSIA